MTSTGLYGSQGSITVKSTDQGLEDSYSTRNIIHNKNDWQGVNGLGISRIWYDKSKRTLSDKLKWFDRSYIVNDRNTGISYGQDCTGRLQI